MAGRSAAARMIYNRLPHPRLAGEGLIGGRTVCGCGFVQMGCGFADGCGDEVGDGWIFCVVMVCNGMEWEM